METTPRILYQTWKTKNVPMEFSKNREIWLGMLDGWETPLLTDKDLRDIVKSDFPQHLDAYDGFTENIERVDFARLVMMYRGGVYADLDTYPVKPIDVWVNTNKIVLGREPLEHAREMYQREVVICNAFMISPPGIPFWKHLMEFIIENYEPYYKPVENTGPMAFTKFLEAHPEAFSDVIITDPCVFFPMMGDEKISKRCNLEKDSYVVHVWQNSWVVNPLNDPRWKNKRYWVCALLLLFIVLWLVCWYRK